MLTACNFGHCVPVIGMKSSFLLLYFQNTAEQYCQGKYEYSSKESIIGSYHPYSCHGDTQPQFLFPFNTNYFELTCFKVIIVRYMN